MQMTPIENQVNKNVFRRLYAQQKTKKDKTKVLNTFCELTGMHRKSALRVLSPNKRPSRRKGRRRKYSCDAQRLLHQIWRLADYPCCRLLRPVMSEWIKSLRLLGREIDEEVVQEVLQMSVRTMERVLAPHLRRGRSWRRSASLSENRKNIPLKMDTWPETAGKEAGWLEVDSVALCGGSMAGRFHSVLDITDISTQWTEMYVTYGLSGENTIAGLKACVEALPFPVKGVNTDNGSEFINRELNESFTDIFPGALRSRSRPYWKNDNAHVEQKNRDRVRRYFHYGRSDCDVITPLLCELARLLSLYDNLYRPTLKLLYKERNGHKYRKFFEKTPKTPVQRVLEDPSVPEASKERVHLLQQEHNPLHLQEKIAKLKRKIQRIEAALAQEKSRPALPAGGGSALRAAPSGSPPSRRKGGGGGAATPPQRPAQPPPPPQRPAQPPSDSLPNFPIS